MSYGVSATGFLGFLYGWGLGGNAGISSGLSFGKSICDTQVYIQYQGAVMGGLGIYAGASAQNGISFSDGPLPVGFSKPAIVIHGEANVGMKISGGASVDLNPNDVLNPNIGVPDYLRKLLSLKGKGGVGMGIMAGVGPGVLGTIATPRLGDYLPFCKKKKNCEEQGK